MISVPTIDLLFQHFRAYNTTLPELVLAVLQNPLLHHHPFTREFVSATPDILAALARHGNTQTKLFAWAHDYMKLEYHEAVSRLARKQSGWHFGALHASAEQLEEFRIEDMAHDIQTREPLLWDLVGVIISGESMSSDPAHTAEPLPLEAEVNEDEYWAALGDDAIPPPDPERPEERPEDRRARLARQRRRSLRVIVSDIDNGLTMH